MVARRILFLGLADYESLLAKGVAPKILERDEEGFFDHVYTVHFPAARSRIIALAPRHTVIEIGPEGLERIRRPRLIRNVLYVLKAARVLLRLVRDEGVNLIRTMDPCVRGCLAMVLGRMNRVPWCVSLHADYEENYRLAGATEAPTIFGSRRLARRVERFVLSRAPLILIVTDYLRHYLQQVGAATSRVRMIPHGVDFTPLLRPPDPTFARRHGLEGKAIVVSATRLSREKYVQEIPQIAALVLERRPDVVFAVLGDGRERAELERAIRQLGLERRVILLGFQSQQTIAEFQRNADVNLCLLSGYSLIEAAGSGRPIVAYDVDWHSELVVDGKTGLLVSRRDVQAAADAIVALLESPALGARLGGAARDVALRHHSLEATRAAKIACYEELLRERARA